MKKLFFFGGVFYFAFFFWFLKQTTLLFKIIFENLFEFDFNYYIYATGCVNLHPNYFDPNKKHG